MNNKISTKSNVKSKRLKIHRAFNLLHNCSDKELKNVNISWIANKLGVTPDHLSKEYRYAFGISLMENIRSRKIKLAKTLLLKHPKMPIGKIAERIGYSQSHFSQVFKSIEVFTPELYRQNRIPTRKH